MRRFVLLLVTIMLLAVPPADAGTYPDDLQGVPCENTHELVAYLTSVSYAPWSIPTGTDLAYVGELECDGDHITATIYCLARYPNWQCVAAPPPDYQHGKTFWWNEVAGCYLAADVRPDGLVAFEAWVFPGDQNYFAGWSSGCFDPIPGHPYPSFVYSELCPLYFWTVDPAPDRVARMLLWEPAYE